MPIDPTRFSRVSVGWLTSTKSIVDADPADTGVVHSVYGPQALGNSHEEPASGDSSGVAGQVYYGDGYLYVCTSANSWSRATLNTF